MWRGVATAVLGSLVLGVGAAHGAPARITDEKKVGDRTITLTVATDAFAAPTNVDVILPTGYDAEPKRRWPVTYVTAGTMNNYNSFRNVVKGVKLTEHYPSIVVSPDGNSGYWSDWYNGGAFGPPKYETFVIDELIPLIDARFRTNPDRSQRAIFGISMGGYGSMLYAARHPDLFSAAATISGAVDSNNPLLAAALSASSMFDGGSFDAINGPRASQEVRWHGHNPTDLAENLRDVDVQVRTADGTLNPGIGENPASADLVSCAVEAGVHMGSVSFHQRLVAIGKTHVWQDYGAGCHTVPNFTREIVDTLAILQRKLAAPSATPQTFDFRSMEPGFDIYGWTVAADPQRALEFMRVRGDADALTVTGTGSTTVTSPARFRGLTKVDVSGAPTAVDRDGRVTATLDLGPAHTVQQYTPGASDATITRTLTLVPWAALRLSRVARVRTGVRVCVRALGGRFTRARIRSGRRTVRAAVGPRTRCRILQGANGSRVVVSGRDAHGHPASATKSVAT